MTIFFKSIIRFDLLQSNNNTLSARKNIDMNFDIYCD